MSSALDHGSSFGSCVWFLDGKFFFQHCIWDPFTVIIPIKCNTCCKCFGHALYLYLSSTFFTNGQRMVRETTLESKIIKVVLTSTLPAPIAGSQCRMLTCPVVDATTVEWLARCFLKSKIGEKFGLMVHPHVHDYYTRENMRKPMKNGPWTMDEDVFPFDIRDFHDQASLSKSWGRGLDGWNVQGASSNFFIFFL